MGTSDLELLSEYARRKDAEAFAALVERYQSFVYATSLRQLGNRADAEEVVQDVFLSLATNAHSISAEKLGGWLYRCTLNAAYSRLRTDRARTARERARATPDRHTDASHEWHQIEEVLDACFAEMPPDGRELLIQRFFANRSQTELAESLGVDQATVSRRLQKAVDQLRRLMASKGVSMTAAALVAGMAEHATSATVPLELSASLNKVGVAGIGKKLATVFPFPFLATLLWPTLGISIAALLVSAATLIVALAGRERGPTTSVVDVVHPLPMAVAAGLTRLDYSRKLSSGGLAINSQGRIVLYVDRPAGVAGVHVAGNNSFQRMGTFPKHEQRSMTIGPRSVAAIYDRHVALINGNGSRLLSDVGASGVTPSINSREWVVLVESEPVSRIRLFDGNEVRTLHSAGDRFTRFDEVCINDDGDVAFRATTNDGVDGIYLSRQGEVAVVAEVGEEFKSFRPWLDLNNHGQLAFAAQRVDGTEALCIGDDRGLEQVVSSGGYFAEIRQGSLNNAGSIAFTARRPEDPADLSIAGLYLWDGTQVVALLPHGQPVGDRLLEGVILWRDCFNDAGQIAIVADFGPSELSAILRLETDDLSIVD
jgi:RNA polymerase sigma-70 factor (ECF subfamily)